MPYFPKPLIRADDTFPSTPIINELFFHTDRGILYYYFSSTIGWLSVNEFDISLPRYSTLLPGITSPVSLALGAIPHHSLSGKIIITQVSESFYIQGGTHDDSNQWTVNASFGPDEIVPSWSTSTEGWGINQWNWRRSSPMTIVTLPATTQGVTSYIASTGTKTGAAGSFYYNITIRYRLVG